MQFSNKKKAVAGALIAVGGLALVGVGTGASFTDTVTANSTFKAGTVDLDISDAPNYDVSADGNTATLKADVHLQHLRCRVDFDTIKVTNNGDIKVPLNVTSATETGHHAARTTVGTGRIDRGERARSGRFGPRQRLVRPRRSPTPTPARPGPSASAFRAPALIPGIS